MSAFICSDRHIATLAKAYAFHAGESEAFARDLANTLKRENIRSVNYRYKQRNRITPCDLSNAVLMDTGDVHYRAIDLQRLAECLDYQSCERKDFAKSVAYCALQRIIACFKEQASRQPWNQSNVWSI